MKTRIISAIFMLIIVVPIIYLGGNLFKIGISIVSLLALKEIMDLKKSHNEIPILVQLVSYVCMLLLVLSEFDGYSIMFGVTYKGIAILLLALLTLSLFKNNKEYTATDALVLIGSILLIGTSFNTLIMVREFSLFKFIFLILIFVLTDTFAYICGKSFGRTKLIEHVSPKKTIEGSILGTLIGTVGASIFYHYLINPITVKVIIGILILSIIGQIGDLIFSKIKRENDIKDFSNLIPGHGGILDRLDSTIAITLGYLIMYNIF